MSSYFTYEGNLRDRNKFTSTVNTSFGTKRYFSSLDTEVYFGSELIDEMVAIDFTISEPKLPIYGFNSFYANRIVSGRRTIQGTFAINFTSTVYLLNVFNRIDDSILKAKYNPTGSDILLDYESLVYRCEGDDTTGLGIGNSALFRKIFDITLSYGWGSNSAKRTYNSCYQTLVGVQIVDYRQALDTEGNPILDMYSFIAKDIMYLDATQQGEQLQDPPSDPGNKPAEPEPEDTMEPLYANENVSEEKNNVTSKCKNTDIPGYIVNPTFNYTPPGSVAASAYPYLRLTIDALNDNTEEFTNVSITISNITINLDNIKKGSSYGDIYEFKESTRDLGVDLRKHFVENESDTVDCTIKFTTKVDGKNVQRSFNTKLYAGSKTTNF